MSAYPRVHRPCDECPWRRTALPGRFPRERYAALRATSHGPNGSADMHAPMFACHKTPEAGEKACAGWLAVEGWGHVGVRLAVAMGRLDGSALEPGDGWPELYPDYEALADANKGVL